MTPFHPQYWKGFSPSQTRTDGTRSPPASDAAPSAPVIDQQDTRVLIRGRLYRTFMTETNATRCAAALRELSRLGCELPEPNEFRSAVRSMLTASCADIEAALAQRQLENQP